MRLECEPALEPLHISVQTLMPWRGSGRGRRIEVSGQRRRARQRGALSLSLLLSSLELSDTQSLRALNTSPPRNRFTFL